MTPRTTWIEPAFSRSDVDRAGRLLVRNRIVADALAVGHALDVVNNWRSSHSFPLNTFQVSLRQRAASICDQPLVVQRLKRIPSIIGKLQRYTSMKLSRMQDLGGTRAVVPNIRDVDDLRDAHLRSRTKHQLTGQKDYVRRPKTSGYRGIHLVYRYHSDRKPQYGGLQIELQLRTARQHAWATAVETVGTFLDRSLKSSEGPREWLRFFELIGSGFALVEGGPVAANVPADAAALIGAVRDAAVSLQVKEKLQTYGAALQVIEHDAALRAHQYFLLVLDPTQTSVTIRAYRSGSLAVATRDYLDREKDLAAVAGAEAVLVASDSLESLRKAYPNYFLDTRTFVKELDSLLA